MTAAVMDILWSREPVVEECAMVRALVIGVSKVRLPAGRNGPSFYFDNQPNMPDQLLINKNMATRRRPIKVNLTTVPIFELPAMVSPGVYPKPISFGGMGEPANP
jgi:hypothetical protein